MDWAHTRDLSDDFWAALDVMCRDKLACAPLDLLGCWMSESGVSAKAINSGGWAAGLFSLEPNTARGLGWKLGDPRWISLDANREAYRRAAKAGDHDGASDGARLVSNIEESLMRQFAALSAAEQLPYAAKYYGPHRGTLGSAAACYVATFLPAELHAASDPNHVLCARGGVRADMPSGKYTWAYDDNRIFDPTHKGWIQVSDLADRIAEATRGTRWNEIVERLRADSGQEKTT